MLNKRPYFFKYLYEDSKKDFKEYVKFQEYRCKKTFRKPLDVLFNQKNFSEEEKKFIEDYYDFCPLIISDSPMNLLCRYIEDIDFHIKSKIKEKKDFNFSLLKNGAVFYTEEQREKIINQIKAFNKEYSSYLALGMGDKKIKYSMLRENLFDIENNQDVIVNVIVDYCYKEEKGNKDLVWLFFGREVFNNLLDNCNKEVYFPFEDKAGDITYLGKKFKVERVNYNE